MLRQTYRQKIWGERQGEGAVIVKLLGVGANKKSYIKRKVMEKYSDLGREVMESLR